MRCADTAGRRRSADVMGLLMLNVQLMLLLLLMVRVQGGRCAQHGGHRTGGR